ncbi:MAG: hypothetical protein ACLP7P_12645 [Rhodomicrobium sp.]
MRIEDYEDVPEEALKAIKEADTERLELIFDNALRVIAVTQQKLNRTKVNLTIQNGGFVVASVLIKDGEKQAVYATIDRDGKFQKP